jgi:hypothetical protein
VLSVRRSRSNGSIIAVSELLRQSIVGTWSDCPPTSTPTDLARNAATRFSNVSAHKHAVARAFDRPFAFGTVILVGFGVERDERGLGLNVN